MNKENFLLVLQASILSFEGMDYNKIVNEHKIKPVLAKAGIRLANYLRNIEIDLEIREDTHTDERGSA